MVPKRPLPKLPTREATEKVIADEKDANTQTIWTVKHAIATGAMVGRPAGSSEIVWTYPPPISEATKPHTDNGNQAEEAQEVPRKIKAFGISRRDRRSPRRGFRWSGVRRARGDGGDDNDFIVLEPPSPAVRPELPNASNDGDPADTRASSGLSDEESEDQAKPDDGAVEDEVSEYEDPQPKKRKAAATGTSAAKASRIPASKKRKGSRK